MGIEDKICLLSPVGLYKNILVGKVRKFPRGYWERSDSVYDAQKITIYLLEKKLKWNKDDIRNKLCKKTFQDYELSGMYQRLFKNSLFDCINNAYPGEFTENDFKPK